MTISGHEHLRVSCAPTWVLGSAGVSPAPVGVPPTGPEHLRVRQIRPSSGTATAAPHLLCGLQRSRRSNNPEGVASPTAFAHTPPRNLPRRTLPGTRCPARGPRPSPGAAMSTRSTVCDLTKRLSLPHTASPIGNTRPPRPPARRSSLVGGSPGAAMSKCAFAAALLLPLRHAVGDHVSRSDRLLWGNHLVAGLGSHWAGERWCLCSIYPALASQT
jgi:hypothetical protein